MRNYNNYIENRVEEFITDSSENSLHINRRQNVWDTPIVGFANANDEFFRKIKEQIGSEYYLPENIFNITFPEIEVEKENINIISWILPKSKGVKLDNRREIEIPSESWVRAKYYGENCNKSLMRHIVDVLTKEGYRAVAPALSSSYRSQIIGEKGKYSNWSERHTAFVCGLGTFGLCDGLITPLGKAVRIGSVITNAPLIPTERKYESHNQYCLFYTDKSCNKCMERCPAGAITEKGHDKIKCSEYLNSIIPVYKNKYALHNIKEKACGLCQTKVPCESSIPMKKNQY